MTHTYLMTSLDSDTARETLRTLLMQMPNIVDVHFPRDSRHVSITLNSYSTMEKINKHIAVSGSDSCLIKQLDVSPDFSEANETTGKIYKEFGYVLVALFVGTLVYGSYLGIDSLNDFLRIYIGISLVSFGVLKTFKLLDFAESHQRYDLISRHFILYGYMYPFIEITLGVFLVINYHVVIAYSILIPILCLRVLSVWHTIAINTKVNYAYLEGFFKIRISYATVIIDLLIILFGFIQLSLLLKGFI